MRKRSADMKEQDWAAPGDPGSTQVTSPAGAVESEKNKPIPESKAIMSLGPPTDGKAAFRQRDLKLVKL